MHAAVDAVVRRRGVRDRCSTTWSRGSPAAARSNALAAEAAALTVPGVPDVYQGSELEERSLVDPDNRRPVDFDAARDLARPTGSGRRSSAVTADALRLRRDRPELFTGVHAAARRGPAAEHVLAFDRGGVVTVVTRLPVGLEATAAGATPTLDAARGSVADVLDRSVDDARPRARDLLADYPVATCSSVALLVRED